MDAQEGLSAALNFSPRSPSKEFFASFKTIGRYHRRAEDVATAHRLLLGTLHPALPRSCMACDHRIFSLGAGNREERKRVGAWNALQDFLSILNLIPASVLPADHIGVRLPVDDTDLPALVVAISAVKETPIGLGGLASLERVSWDQWKETRGSRSAGLMTIEVWGATAEKIVELTDAVFKHLETPETKLRLSSLVTGSRQAGFLKFVNQEVRPIEEVKLGTSDSKGLRMAIGFSIVYEEIKNETIGPEGIIKRIDVDIHDQFDESMSIHK